MTEARFRAWCLRTKRMMYAPTQDGNSIKFFKLTEYREEHWHLGKFKDDEVIYSTNGILMEYTLLNTEKKRGNKPIYEGDIVKGKECGWENLPFKIKGWDGLRIGVVINHYGTIYYSIDGVNPHQMLIYMSNVEVLGNKYENPELLKELR